MTELYWRLLAHVTAHRNCVSFKKYCRHCYGELYC